METDVHIFKPQSHTVHILVIYIVLMITTHSLTYIYIYMVYKTAGTTVDK